MDTDLAQKAVAAAISGDWEEALKINLSIIKQNKHDCDALNRCARAYAELGKILLAKKTALEVLKIDPSNRIARKCFDKWKEIKKGGQAASKVTSGNSFIEEPGKTRIVSLLNTGSPQILARIDAGDEVILNPRGHRTAVTTTDGTYIGRLPDDISLKIKNLIKMGKKYQVLVKSIEDKNVKVFIKEVSSSKGAESIQSFSSEKIEYISFTSPKFINREDSKSVDEEAS